MRPWGGCVVASAAFLVAARLVGLQNRLGKIGGARCRPLDGRRCKCACDEITRYCCKHGRPSDGASAASDRGNVTKCGPDVLAKVDAKDRNIHSHSSSEPPATLRRRKEGRAIP
jgi:hypothetical protein